jgi:hypothetical protein
MESSSIPPQHSVELPSPNVPHTCTWTPVGASDCNIIITGSPAKFFGSANTQPITLTFSAPVQDLHSFINGAFLATEYCTSQPWNTMTWTAFKPDGSVAETGVYFNNPNTGCIWFHPQPTVVMHLHFQGPVSRLRINPPSAMPPDQTTTGEAVRFYFYYNPACPPSGDPMLDPTTVRAGLFNVLANGQPNSDPQLRLRRETGGLLVRGADGAYRVVEAIDLQATSCDYSHARATATLQPGDTVKAGIHSHPHLEGELVYDDCKRVPPGKKGHAHPSVNGGGSDQDWDNATASGFPEYVITKEGIISRLTPGTPKGTARKNNQNRWTFNPSNNLSCFTPKQP